MSSDEAFVLRILAALKSVRLEAVVVGSVAAILQGVPVTTQDLDLLIRDTPRNRQKIAALGAALGSRARRISPLTTMLRFDLPAGAVDLLFDIHRHGALRVRGQKGVLGSRRNASRVGG